MYLSLKNCYYTLSQNHYNVHIMVTYTLSNQLKKLSFEIFKIYNQSSLFVTLEMNLIQIIMAMYYLTLNLTHTLNYNFYRLPLYMCDI